MPGFSMRHKMSSNNSCDLLSATPEAPCQDGRRAHCNASMVPLMVIAVGVRTDHWPLMFENFPDVNNCCLNVIDAFHREYDEDTHGTGLDEAVRDRIKMKAAWDTVWEVAIATLRMFGLVIAFCRHGKHRSLALAYELASSTGATLVHTRHSLRDPRRFLRHITPRLTQHRQLYAGVPPPVARIGVAKVEFNGPEWCNEPGEPGNNGPIEPTDLHVLHKGDIIVEMHPPSNVDAAGWAYGTVINGRDRVVVRGLWFPPVVFERLMWNHFCGTGDLEGSLFSLWTQGAGVWTELGIWGSGERRRG